MPPPSKSEVENMAFKALMGSIGIGHLPCDCPKCSKQSKSSARPEAAKRKGSDKEKADAAPLDTSSPTGCGHHHHHRLPELRPPLGSRKASSPAPSQARASPMSTSANSGRTDKVNSLLKADSHAAVFEVFNATSTTADEKELVAQIQTVTQECKTYPDSKTKIMKLCNSAEIGPDAVCGLLAKFRHERNLLTSAILKSNSEREKALLCIKRVDDLMYMLSDVSKRPKDSSSEGIMASLGEIIMEVHEIAKHPSVLYEELLDIRDDHLQLLDDHDDMHQKFIDVNSCHDRLHANYEKLQTSNSKLTIDYADVKKKASMVNGLKQDVTRLEKAVDRKQDENAELKKEVDKLNSELAKVNALRHEVAQLKKKNALLNAPAAVEASTSQPTTNKTPSNQPVPVAQPGLAKKKKGKKGNANTAALTEEVVSDKVSNESSSVIEKSSAQEDLLKLQKSYEAAVQELALLRENLAQIDKLRQKAERSRDEAVEKLQFEAATSQNWQEISESNAEDKAKLQGLIDHYKSVIQNLQWTTKKQEEDLSEATRGLTMQKSAFEQVKAELDNRSHTPATSATDRTTPFTDDALRMLRRVRAEITQLMKDVDDSLVRNIDLSALLQMIQITVYRIVADAERSIEEMLSSSGFLPSSRSTLEMTMSPAYPRTNQPRNLQQQQSYERFDHSPQPSPSMSMSHAASSGMIGTAPTSYRPSIPPGFGDYSPLPSPMHNFGRTTDLPTLNSNHLSLHPTPKSTMSPLTMSTSQTQGSQPTTAPDFGPIGSRLPSSSLRSLSSSGGGSKVPDASNSSSKTPPPLTSLNLGGASASSNNVGLGLGNGAHGVDWSRWSKVGK